MSDLPPISLAIFRTITSWHIFHSLVSYAVHPVSYRCLQPHCLYFCLSLYFFCLSILSAPYYLYRSTIRSTTPSAIPQRQKFLFLANSFIHSSCIASLKHTAPMLIHPLDLLCISCLTITIIVDLPSDLSLLLPFQNQLPLLSFHTTTSKRR